MPRKNSPSQFLLVASVLALGLLARNGDVVIDPDMVDRQRVGGPGAVALFIELDPTDSPFQRSGHAANG